MICDDTSVSGTAFAMSEYDTSVYICTEDILVEELLPESFQVRADYVKNYNEVAPKELKRCKSFSINHNLSKGQIPTFRAKGNR